MTRPTIAVFVILCSSLLALGAAGQDLEKLLTDQYQGKVLVLRHCYRADSQEYDAAGKLTGKSDEGPWPSYGRIQVKSLSLTADKLRFEGNRAVYKVGQDDRLQLFEDKAHVTVTIQLEQPLASLADASTILGRVFAITLEDVVNAAPSYWQSYLAKNLGVEGPEKARAKASTNTDAASGPRAEEVLHLGQDVAAPKPIYTPYPASIGQNIDGVVGMNVIIDKAGHVGNISILHALGMGLDEDAVSTVSKWRFSPAKRNGQPVAVALYIEVDFHLHGR